MVKENNPVGTGRISSLFSSLQTITSGLALVSLIETGSLYEGRA